MIKFQARLKSARGWTCEECGAPDDRARLPDGKWSPVCEACADWIREADVRRRWLYTAVTRAAERLVIVGR